MKLFTASEVSLKTTDVPFDVNEQQLPAFAFYGGNALVIDATILAVDGRVEDIELHVDQSLDGSNWRSKHVATLDWQQPASLTNITGVSAAMLRVKVLLRNADAATQPVSITMALACSAAQL